MDELHEQVEKLRLSTLRRKKERYALAKELGFTPAESSILAGKPESYIRDLSKKRNMG